MINIKSLTATWQWRAFIVFFLLIIDWFIEFLCDSIQTISDYRSWPKGEINIFYFIKYSLEYVSPFQDILYNLLSISPALILMIWWIYRRHIFKIIFALVYLFFYWITILKSFFYFFHIKEILLECDAIDRLPLSLKLLAKFMYW